MHTLTPEILLQLPREDLAGYLLEEITLDDAECFGEIVQRAVDAWPHGDVPVTWLRVRLVSSAVTVTGIRTPLGRETLELREGVVHKLASVFGGSAEASAYALIPPGKRGRVGADALEAKGWNFNGRAASLDAPPGVVVRRNPRGDAFDDGDDDDSVELGRGASTWAGPHSQLVRRAMAIYTLWTEKQPDDSSLWQDVVSVQNVDWDQLDVRRVGYGGDILYTSDKWEKPGVLEKYHHPFGPGTYPSVYCAAHDGGDDSEPVSVAQLLGVRSLREPVALTPLALGDELVVQVPDEANMTWRFSSSDDPPALCSTLDKKGLVILSKDKGPIFIRGGRMRVTARGIVG